MRKFVVFASVLAVSTALAAPAGAAIVVENSHFIAAPTSFNGFEGIASNPNFSAPFYFPGNTPYSEGGITVEYVGSAPNQMWLQYQFVGDFGWYANGGGTGYTKVTLSNGGDFGALEFLAGSGFSGGSTTYYEALFNGTVVSTGTIGAVTDGYGNNGLQYFGLSGGGFDEVHLKSNFDGAFNPNTFEAGSFDSFAALSAAPGVPEPASWALMIAGFGLTGAAMRRRQSVRVTYA